MIEFKQTGFFDKVSWGIKMVTFLNLMVICGCVNELVVLMVTGRWKGRVTGKH